MRDNNLNKEKIMYANRQDKLNHIVHRMYIYIDVRLMYYFSYIICFFSVKPSTHINGYNDEKI